MDRLSMIQDDTDVQYNERGIVILPREFDDAPEDIKQLYINWLQLGKETREHPRRYFQFVNSKTKEVESVDTLLFNGMAVKRAKEKNISPTDLTSLEDLCKEMEERKHQKSRLKFAWLKWIRPRLGKDIFDWRKADIIDEFAKYKTFEEVEEILKNWGYQTDSVLIYKFFLKNKDTIDRKRMEFIRSAKDHYLATDAGRVETLSILYSKFMAIFNDLYSKKDRDTTQIRTELKGISQEIRAIIEQVRKEIKGDEVKLTIDGKIDVNATLMAASTITDISKKVPIHLIPVYLTAAKQHINPHIILTALTSSFYSQFNGFSKLSTNLVPTTMDLIRNYDWNEIEQYQRSKPDSSIQDVSYEELPLKDTQKVQSNRDKLLEIIKNDQNSMEE